MKMSKLMSTVAVGAMLVASVSQASEVNRQEYAAVDLIPYVTGGIGATEREEMHAIEPNYNFRLEMATASGHYIGNADVEIRDANGDVMLQTKADGPLLFADLDPGKYSLNVTRNGELKMKNFSISKASKRNVLLLWNDAYSS